MKQGLITEKIIYGYSPKGERCYDPKSGKRTERVSWISALRGKSLFASLTFNGSCNRRDMVN